MSTRNIYSDINQNILYPNQRYSRSQIKPIARSVYNDNKVVRLNGSFNGSIGTTGLHMGVLS